MSAEHLISRSPAPAQRRRGITPKMRETFLAALESGFSVTHAAERAGRHRRRFYQLAEDDEQFAETMADAIEAGTEVLIDEARRRAVDGWEEEVYQGGELVGTVRRYDSKLLQFLIAARRPEYRQGASNGESGPVTLNIISAFPGVRRADVIELEAEELPALEEGEA